MQRITDNQLIHRAYLQSALWKEKRLQALSFYGCKCNRCQQHGTDVHHKTYDRVGGNEIMEDLEILCRDCHSAHHAIDKTVSKSKIKRGIHKRAIYGRLTAKQCQVLWDKFKRIKNLNDLFIAINKPGKSDVAEEAAKLLGCDYVFSSRATPNQPRRSKNRRW